MDKKNENRSFSFIVLVVYCESLVDIFYNNNVIKKDQYYQLSRGFCQTKSARYTQPSFTARTTSSAADLMPVFFSIFLRCLSTVSLLMFK